MGSLLNLVAFAFGLYLAWSGQWSTRDLVWSFWLTSLGCGSLTLLSFIFAQSIDRWRTQARRVPAEVLAREARRPMSGVSRGVEHWTANPSNPARPPMNRVSGGGSAIFLVAFVFQVLFLLVFFTLHFGMFHIGHAVFLHFIFPISELSALNLRAEDLILNSGSGNLALVPKILSGALEGIVAPYGLFVLTTLFVEREKITEPISAVFAKSSAEHRARRRGGFIILPYINVIKTNLLIFLCFFAKQFNLEDSFWLFVFVYSLFCLSTLIKSLRSEKASMLSR